jgi:hypothetical protein
MATGNHVCLTCMGDEHVRALALPTAGHGDCDYCASVNVPGIALGEVAELITETLEQSLVPGDDEAHYGGDSDRPEYVQEGDDLCTTLQNELEIDDQLASDLADELIERDPTDPRDGGSPFFDSETCYVRRHVRGTEYDALWREFCDRVKHKHRFFDERARNLLAQLLGEGLAGTGAPEPRLPELVVGPSTRIPFLHRARCARSQEEAKLFLHTSRELGPPPHDKATAGRMNPQGIPVFYGAASLDTAVSEVRASVGGLVVIGQFHVERTLRLLDLSRIQMQFTGSIFAPGYLDRAARARFLEGFHARIMRPVLPHEEALEYLPTQAVAEYVHTTLNFDGIFYQSVQLGEIEDPEQSQYVRNVEISDEELGRHNVVLLGAATDIPRLVAASVVRVTAVEVRHSREFPQFW